MGLAIMFIVGVLWVALLIAAYLLQPEANEAVESGHETRISWRQKLSSFRNMFVKEAPFSAISIVAVVLQIVTQVCALGQCTCALATRQTRVTTIYMSVLAKVEVSLHGSIILPSLIDENSGSFHRLVEAAEEMRQTSLGVIEASTVVESRPKDWNDFMNEKEPSIRRRSTSLRGSNVPLHD